MKVFNLLLGILITAAFSSCYSSMKVKVDALNMPAFRATYLYNEESINQRERQLFYIVSDEFQKQLQVDLMAVVSFINTSGQVPTDDTAEYSNEIRTKYNATIPTLVSNSYKLLDDSKKLTGAGDLMTFQQSYNRSFANFSVSLDAFSSYIRICSEILADIGTSDAARLNEQLSITASNVPSKSAFGESIVSNPMASIVAALPEQYWSRYEPEVNLSTNAGGINYQSLGDISKYVKKDPNRFNNTFARTRFGNSDIAIIMSTPGEFIVKGVRVDADEAIRNSFKVVSQGIKYLAYSSGIPVVEGHNVPKKSIVPLLDSIEQKENDLLSTKDRYTKSTDAFLAILIDASDDLNAKKAKPGQTLAGMKDAALARIKTAYEIYKSNLSK